MMNVCLALLFTDVLALPSQAFQQSTSAEFQKLINGDEGDAASPKTGPEVEVTEPAVEITDKDVEITEPELEVEAPEPDVEITEPKPEVDETIAVDPVDETIAVDPVGEVEPATEASADKEGISCGGHDEKVCGNCLEAAEEAKVDDKASYCNGDCQLALGEAPEDDVCSANGTAKFVDCGEHQAGDCAACANTARKHYCNGVCQWSDEENTCVLA